MNRFLRRIDHGEFPGLSDTRHTHGATVPAATPRQSCTRE